MERWHQLAAFVGTSLAAVCHRRVVHTALATGHILEQHSLVVLAVLAVEHSTLVASKQPCLDPDLGVEHILVVLADPLELAVRIVVGLMEHSGE